MLEIFAMNCMYCEETHEKRTELLIEVGKLAHSTLFILKNQNHLGRVVLALNGHRQEVFEMTEEERNGFFADVALVSKAMQGLFNPDKINYGIFGDGVPHVHMHIVPKYKNQLQWGHFFWDKGEAEVTLSDAEYAQMAANYKKLLKL